MTRINYKKQNKKEMEYEDAPSGFVKLYNYKEPFMKFLNGFGYEGVLLFDGETEKVQCHFCGQWFGYLPPHINAEHRMTASEYKEKVGLRQTTALISESAREKLIAAGLDKRLQNLRQNGRDKRKYAPVPEAVKQKIRNSLKKMVRETQNERGTCPEQLIERLIKKANELGRTPTSKETPAYESMVRVFGSYMKACEAAGLQPNTHKVITERRNKHSKTLEELKTFVVTFAEAHKRLPTNKDFINSGNHRLYEVFRRQKKSKGVSAFIKNLIASDGVFRKVEEHIEYNKEELLQFLRNFEKIHKRKPSYSDSKRGLLPVLSRYLYHFGSWRNALSEAFNS